MMHGFNRNGEGREGNRGVTGEPFIRIYNPGSWGKDCSNGECVVCTG